MFPLLLQALPFIAQHGKDIAALIHAGQPIKDSVVAQAPELWDIFKKMAPQMPAQMTANHPAGSVGPASTADAIAETIARQAFVPHMTTVEEKAWMDRASASFG